MPTSEILPPHPASRRHAAGAVSSASEQRTPAGPVLDRARPSKRASPRACAATWAALAAALATLAAGCLAGKSEPRVPGAGSRAAKAPRAGSGQDQGGSLPGLGPPSGTGPGGHAPATAGVAAPRSEGRALFAALCASCHGHDGRAAVPLASDLSPRPADLSRCNFKLRSTPSGSLPQDADLLRTLHVGLPGSAMPSFADIVGKAGLHALVREVKERCSLFAREEPEPSLPHPAPPRYTKAAVERGREVFRREACASCHGEGGRGDGPAARSLRDASGRRLPPRDLTAGVFRSGFSRRDIYRAFSTGMNGAAMPALPDEVNEASRWDLTHFIVSLSASRGRARRLLLEAPGWYEPARTWSLPWH